MANDNEITIEVAYGTAEQQRLYRFRLPANSTARQAALAALVLNDFPEAQPHTAPLGIFLDPVVEAATSGDDFRLDDLRRKRMTVYIGINPTETATFSRLTNLFFSQLVQVNVAQGLPENNLDASGQTTLPFQCLLLMDEFPALGNVQAIQEGVSYVAGYGLRLMIIAQSPAQIEAVYGRENARTFFTNFAARAIFTPRDQAEAEE